MIETWAEFEVCGGGKALVRLDSVAQVIADKGTVIIVSEGCEDLRVTDPYERVCAIVYGATHHGEVRA